MIRRHSLARPRLLAAVAVVLAVAAAVATSCDFGAGGARVVSALDAGASGNGRTDDTAALQRVLDELRSGDTLLLPEHRVFAHGGVLTIRHAGITITGGGTLLATHEDASAIRIAADRVTVSHVTAKTAHTSHRWRTPKQTGIWLDHHADVVLDRVTVQGAGSAGVFVQGAQSFRLSDVTVRETRADGIHMTDGASNGLVSDPLTENTGDDGVAVVSYTRDQSQSHDIRIQSPHVHGNTGGRGIAVVGARAVTVTDVDIRATAGAGFYVACERGRYDTRVPSGVTVIGGTIDHANQNTAIDHGAVLLYNAEAVEPLSNIRLQDIRVVDTRPSASRQVGLLAPGNGSMSGVALINLSFSGTGPRTLLGTNSNRLEFRTTGWTEDGIEVPDRHVDSGTR